MLKYQKRLKCLNAISSQNLLYRWLEQKYNYSKGNTSFYCNRVRFFLNFSYVRYMSTWTFAKHPFYISRTYERLRDMWIMRIENLAYIILHKAPIFNSVSPNAPLMEKLCRWFLLAKCVKNTCEKVKFSIKIQIKPLKVTNQ